MEETQKHLPIEAYRIGMNILVEDNMGKLWGKCIGIKNDMLCVDPESRPWPIIMPFPEFHFKNCKPILRRMEDMTEEDKEMYIKLCFMTISTNWEDHVNGRLIETGKARDFARNKGYDVDGWIDAGLAIDEKTLNIN